MRDESDQGAIRRNATGENQIGALKQRVADGGFQALSGDHGAQYTCPSTPRAAPPAKERRSRVPPLSPADFKIAISPRLDMDVISPPAGMAISRVPPALSSM